MPALDPNRTAWPRSRWPSAVTLAAALLVVPASALQSDAADERGAPRADEQERPDVRPVGGPDSVQRSISGVVRQDSLFAMDGVRRWAAPYIDWTKRLKEEHGLTFNFSAHILAQQASETLSGRKSGFGGIYRFQGSWVAFARDTGYPGHLDWRLEARDRIGGSQSPDQLGADAGAAALNTASGYNPDYHTDLGVISWTQLFADQRAGVVFGRVAFDVYQDAFLFQGFSRGFLNRGFFFNPTIATTGVGALGLVAQGFVSDQVWLGGQIFDGNARSGEFDLDTVREGEFLKNVEIGWTPSIERFKADRIHLTFWEMDERQAAGVGAGRGFAVSASYQVTERIIPFLRFGHSNGGGGALAESSAATGFELSPRPDQAWSLGFAWARPSVDTFGAELRDEYAIETSYKLQVTPNISVTPDLQLLVNPAQNPAADQVWVVGLRTILSI